MNKTEERNLIASRIKKLRTEKKLSQQKVADLLGLKLQAYQAYEECRAQPSTFSLKTLATFYGFQTIDELLQWDSLLKFLPASTGQ